VLADAPTCGEWYPEIYSDHGLIPLDTTATKIKIDCTVTAITPNTDLNVLGGDNLTISGTNFPKFVADNSVDIGFSNSDSTKCVLQSSKSTEMICLTKPFDKVANLDTEFTMAININNQTVAQDLKIKMKPINKDATQIIPNSASPVLKTMIKFKIEAGFTYPVNDPSEWTVNMTLITISPQVSPYYKRSQNTNIRQLNVVSANATDNSIEAMFGGAYSGTYSV